MQHTSSLATMLRNFAPHAFAAALLAVGAAACGSPTPTPTSVCAHMASAGCSGFNMDSCVSQQEALQTACTNAGQSSASQSLLNCSATASFTCGSDGQPTSSDCAFQALGVLSCVLPGGTDSGTGNDASTVD